MMPRPTGLILAGGQSRRFGADKAAYAVGGRSMLERVYAAVAVVADPVLLSLRTPPGTSLSIPARVVVDRYADAGPLAGLHAGLLEARTPWLLAVACDLPYLTPEALSRLVERCTPEARAVVAEDETGRLQPLCACYPTSALPVVEARLRGQSYALHGLLDHLEPFARVPLSGGVLRNVNRPGDLE